MNVRAARTTLLKKITVASFLMFACCRVGPSCSPAIANPGLTIKGRVQKDQKVVPLNALLKPGQKFDIIIASRLLERTKYQNNWSKIPFWFVRSWEKPVEVSSAGRLSKKTKCDTSESNNLVATTGGGYARFQDSTGQWWMSDTPPYWAIYDEGSTLRYNYEVSGVPSIYSDDEASGYHRDVVFYVDTKSRKIISVEQNSTEVQEFIEKTEPMTLRTVTAKKAFDANAVLKDSGEWTSLSKDHGPYTPPDRRVARNLWIEFLRTNGMEDRIPQETTEKLLVPSLIIGGQSLLQSTGNPLNKTPLDSVKPPKRLTLEQVPQFIDELRSSKKE